MNPRRSPVLSVERAWLNVHPSRVKLKNFERLFSWRPKGNRLFTGERVEVVIRRVGGGRGRKP